MQVRESGPIPSTFHPIRALRALATLARNNYDTEAGSELVYSLSFGSRERHFRRLFRDPTIARMLAERRSLFDALNDRDSLAAMPAGSLGRALFEWTRDEQISAQGFMDVMSRAIPSSALDDDRKWLELRGQASHDLWHIVTGYGRDLLGELLLSHFTEIQTHNTGMVLPNFLAFLHPGFRSPETREVIWEARRRARRAAWLPAQDWESLLDRPLAEVRSLLALGDPPKYVPVSQG